MNTPLLSRRQFLSAATAASVLASARPLSLFAKNEKATSHFSASKLCAFEKPLQFLSFDETAELFAEQGFNGIEAAARKGGHVLPEKVEEDLPRFVEALQK